jgi:hypothetical protein
MAVSGNPPILVTARRTNLRTSNNLSQSRRLVVSCVTCLLPDIYANRRSLARNLILSLGKATNPNKRKTMFRTIDTVHEYRLRYPDTAPIPTLTQSGALGFLLAVQDKKAAARARRRAMWQRVWSGPNNAWCGVWRALTATELHHHPEPIRLATRPQP